MDIANESGSAGKSTNDTSERSLELQGAQFYEATPQLPILSPDLSERIRITQDRNCSMEERVEAFDDILDSEVGDTSMTRARNLEREFGIRQLYLKFEGSNPSGSQKDRIAFAQARDAMRRGFEGITVATCGNYGVAMSLAAKIAGLTCTIFIPEAYHTKRINDMVQQGALIRRTRGDYEAAVAASQKFAEEAEVYDANPGGTNTVIQLRGYSQIAWEIYDDLRDAPAVVASPVSNGTTLAGIYRGFVSLYRRGKVSHLPRFVAGSSFRKNPIIQALARNLPNCSDLDPAKIKETAINEPLINWHAIDGDYVLEAVRTTHGFGGYVSDKSLLSLSRLILQREGLNVLPASTAGLAVLLEQHRKESLPGDRYVIMLTGRK